MKTLCLSIAFKAHFTTKANAIHQSFFKSTKTASAKILINNYLLKLNIAHEPWVKLISLELKYTQKQNYYHHKDERTTFHNDLQPYLIIKTLKRAEILRKKQNGSNKSYLKNSRTFI
jgi:hypothetical protein